MTIQSTPSSNPNVREAGPGALTILCPYSRKTIIGTRSQQCSITLWARNTYQHKLFIRGCTRDLHSPGRGRTHGPCNRGADSWPLDHQEGPRLPPPQISARPGGKQNTVHPITIDDTNKTPFESYCVTLGDLGELWKRAVDTLTREESVMKCQDIQESDKLLVGLQTSTAIMENSVESP